ncbi:MAG: FKBP-type peptidyl-prolyl cis-trans isomerase [Oscillospiraceae bacterium]|jgi:trigger factor|nr:FKBP-type peptidyl-prolyl cis-trans isomerase [Oscillospiraceae bacterium]
MKKKYLRSLALVLAGILLMATLAGCSPKETFQKIKDKFSKDKGVVSLADEDPLATPPYSAYKLSEYIKLGEYKGVEYTGKAASITDEEVLTTAKSYFQSSENPTAPQMGVIQTPGKTVVATGDVVYFDFEGTGEGFTEETLAGMKGEGYALEIGSENFIPGFEDEMIGKGIGKAFSFDITFPEDYGNEAYNGKEVKFTCTIHTIGSFAITDEAVNTLTSGQITTAKDLLAYVKTQLAQPYDVQAAYKAAFENAEILKLPENERNYYLGAIEERVSALEEESSFNRQEYLEGQSVTDTWEDYFDNQTDTQIKDELFVYAVAEKEGFAVTEEDYTTLLTQIRDYYTNQGSDMTEVTDEELIANEFGNKRDAVVYLMRQKVSELIYTNATEI